MRVTQVAVNLLTNAVKYTPEGRVDLYVERQSRDDKSIDLRIRVKDTGIGIKEEDIGKLFESFTRLEETRNRNIEGTGLGMAIVNRLLKMMDSKLEVESVYGEGSEFAFSVRQEVMDPQPIGDYEIRAKAAMDKEVDDSYLYAPDARLLIVDDNEMNLKVISNLLKLNGIKPDLALSGQEMLDRLKAGNMYDVIMLDHMMPGMDGVETLKKAKEDDLISEGCHVIALTANAVVGARESYLSAGFDDYLSKPVEVSAMESILAKFLPEDAVSFRKKSEYVRDNIEEGEKYDTGNRFDRLAKAGIDINEGLRFCGGDEEFYESVLAEYLATSNGRRGELDDALSSHDMNDYGIKVHALKSVSRTIGAAGIADIAQSLENAAKNGDEENVRGAHAGLFEEYDKVIAAIGSLGLDTDGSGSDDDDEILEFGPA